MPNDFQQWVSLIANIATILGLVIAFTVWINWKKQQNYPFIRDKLSEQELCLTNLLLSFQSTMENYFSLRKNELSAANDREIEEVRKKFELSYDTLKANSSRYDVNHIFISNLAFKKFSGYQIDRIHIEAINLPSLRMRFDFLKKEMDKIESIEVIEEKCTFELELVRRTIRDIMIVIVTIRADL
ncbi:hypothetical protein [Acinetobacter sp. yr461]|uniref:hypothetical protein n=1 Tax=Acinetobacter sp. yr461 TaxID=1761742 RepID=UPI0008BBDC13|nr:hypothetical protein [Acinetobacter sp. yr461]SEO13357.1 hypothetical protein SAMN04487817_101564 [Acinetobacter sp. yr461]